MIRSIFFLCILFLNLTVLRAQDVHSGAKITSSKVVIGFPQITDQQLDEIKLIYLNQPQIASAVFYKSNNYCMLIQLSQGQTKFTVFDELIKIGYSAYDVSKCYVKPTEAYDVIVANSIPGTDILIK